MDIQLIDPKICEFPSLKWNTQWIFIILIRIRVCIVLRFERGYGYLQFWSKNGCLSFSGQRQSMDFYIFYQKVCFALCAETGLGFCSFLKRQCASFPFLTLLSKKWVCFIPRLQIGYFYVHVWLEKGYVSLYGLKQVMGMFYSMVLKWVWIFNNLIGKFVSFLLSNEVSYGFLEFWLEYGSASFYGVRESMVIYSCNEQLLFKESFDLNQKALAWYVKPS